MGIKGIARNGVIQIEGGEKLPEGMKVEVVVEAALLGKGLEKYVGTVSGPADFARNHDPRIHGTPKK